MPAPRLPGSSTARPSTISNGLGFTNHPGLIRGMVKVANAIKDDSFVGGNAGRGTGTMDPKALYPNSQHN